jgi:hypothetical protein
LKSASAREYDKNAMIPAKVISIDPRERIEDLRPDGPSAPAEIQGEGMADFQAASRH